MWATFVFHQLSLGSLMDDEEITIAVNPASRAVHLTYVEDNASVDILDAKFQLIGATLSLSHFSICS